MFMERSTTQSNMAYQRHIGLAPILRSSSGKPFLLEFNMKTIPLTQGKVALVDDKDFKRLNKFKWSAWTNGTHWYAVRGIYMHKEIIGDVSMAIEIDHKNKNGLDNRRSNLRKCTRSQNSHNTNGHKDRRSKYKGLTYRKRDNKWEARICINSIRIHLGMFKNEIDAAKAYDVGAMKHFGKYAHLNFRE